MKEVKEVKTQKKLASLSESGANTVVGLILATIVWMFYVAPRTDAGTLDLQNWADATLVTIIYTVLNFVRGYTLRRIYAKGCGQRKSHSMIETITNTCVAFVLSQFSFMVIIAPTLLFFSLEAHNIIVSSVVTAYFTMLSMARSYWLRRFFTSIQHKHIPSPKKMMIIAYQYIMDKITSKEIAAQSNNDFVKEKLCSRPINDKIGYDYGLVAKYNASKLYFITLFDKQIISRYYIYWSHFWQPAFHSIEQKMIESLNKQKRFMRFSFLK